MNNLTETTQIQQFKAYLQNVVAATKAMPEKTDWKYRVFEELVLEYGTIVEPKPLFFIQPKKRRLSNDCSHQ